MENKLLEIITYQLREKPLIREKAEKIFMENNISEFKDKIDSLNSCMGNPKTFFSTGNEITIEQKYEQTMQMYLTGAWELALYLKRVRASVK